MTEMDELTELLLAKTADGKVSWNLDGDERIVTRQGKNVIEISFSANMTSVANILVRNQDGIIIVSEDFEQFENSYEKLVDIFRIVKRSALKVDETLFDISRRLRAL